MHPIKFYKRAPFRLALLYSVVFMIAYLVSAAVALQYIQKKLDNRLDSLVYEQYTNITRRQTGEDASKLITVIASQVTVSANDSRVYLLRNADGNTLAGNVSQSVDINGFATLPGSNFGRAENTQYRILAGRINDMDLQVGVSDKDTREIRTFVFESFGIASILVVFMTLGGAAFLMMRSQRRLDAITQSIRKLNNGNLGTRLQISSRKDDIDYITSEFNSTLDELQSMMTALDTVSTNIAHDLKSPINRLFVDIETARLKAIRHENVVTDLDKAKSELVSINNTFDALLRIARIEQSAKKESFELVELHEFVANIADTYTPVFEDRLMSLTILNDFEHSLEILADEGLLTQLVVNILENSLRFCPTGAHISIEISRADDKAIISISDSGPGIPDDEKPKVFQRLYRVDTSRSSIGSGLGLSLVRAIARLHDATVSLGDNHPGLKVIVAFPRAR